MTTLLTLPMGAALLLSFCVMPVSNNVMMGASDDDGDADVDAAFPSLCFKISSILNDFIFLGSETDVLADIWCIQNRQTEGDKRINSISYKTIYINVVVIHVPHLEPLQHNAPTQCAYLTPTPSRAFNRIRLSSVVTLTGAYSTLYKSLVYYTTITKLYSL